MTVTNTGVSPIGLRASYAFDEGIGSAAADSSGNFMTGSVLGSVEQRSLRRRRVARRRQRPDRPSGTRHVLQDRVHLRGLGAQVDHKKDVAVLGIVVAAQGGGPMIWVDHIAGPLPPHARRQLCSDYLDSGRDADRRAVGARRRDLRRQHARFYVGGVEVASRPSPARRQPNTWRLGAYGDAPTGFFDGRIDNVRIYDRALSASEIQADMASRIQPETTPPTVTASTPADGAAGVNAAPRRRRRSTSRWRRPRSTRHVPAQERRERRRPRHRRYDAATRTATLTPQTALAYGATYTATVKGGAGGVNDVAGNALAANVIWSFTTEAVAAAAPRDHVDREAVRHLPAARSSQNEGLNAFTTIDVAFLSPALLSGFDVVVLGDTALNPAQVSTLTAGSTAAAT